MTASCAFCGRATNSAQKAWPEWLTRLIKSRIKDNPWPNITPQGGDWPLPNLTATTDRVCNACLERWEPLEETARPMVSKLVTTGGGRVEITPELSKAISWWAYKTALVIDLLYPEGPKLPKSRFRSFGTDLRVPDSCFIFLGALADPDAHAWRMFRAAGDAAALVLVRAGPRDSSKLLGEFALPNVESVLMTWYFLQAVFQVYMPIGEPPRRATDSNDPWLLIWPQPTKKFLWPANNNALNLKSLVFLASNVRL